MKKLSICRTLVVFALLSLLVAYNVGAGGTQEESKPVAIASEGFNWRQFEGTTLHLNFQNHGWTTAMKEHFPEFEELTGIKLKVDVLPFVQSRQKIMIEFTAGSSELDVFFSPLHVQKKAFNLAGWYHPLNEFLNDPNLCPPDYDWNDYSEIARAMNTQPDGNITTLPVRIAPSIFFYRKDILQENGLQPPKTLAEIEEIAKKLHNPPELFGYVDRGKKYDNAGNWGTYFLNYGGEYMDKNGVLNVNSPEGIESLTFFARLMREYGPPGIESYGWSQSIQTFTQGKAVMCADAALFGRQFEDAEKSKVAGKVGYIPHPAGPGGHVAPIWGDGLAVSSLSDNKKAAFLFCAWITNKENTTRAAVEGGIEVGRTSVLMDPDYRSKVSLPDDWMEALSESLKIGKAALPDIIAVAEYRDVVGIAISNAIGGADPKKELDEANEKMKKIIAETEE